MKHSLEATGYAIVAFLSFVLLLSGFKPPSKPSVPATLGVPLVAQIGTCWCWAACEEMVSTYYHELDPKNPLITQCEAVRAELPENTTMPCPQSAPVADSFDFTGIPFTTKNSAYGWNQYPGPVRINSAIPHDSLAKEFAAGRPVIFQWQWVGVAPKDSSKNGLHFLVAEGCPQERYGGQWVAVNDPMPYTMGHHRVMAYEVFANMINAPAQPGDRKGDRSKVHTYNKAYQFNAHGADLINVKPFGK